MSTTVFLSYDNSVRDIVTSLYSVLTHNEITVYANEAGSSEELLKKYEIQNLMRKSDVILFFLSNRSYNNSNIWLELGMAKATHKNIILVVESGVDIPQGVKDIPFIAWSRHNPDFTVNQILNYTNKIKEDKEKSNSAIGILLLLGALAYFISKNDEEEN